MTICSRIANLYRNGGKYADCTFLIDNEQIHCHKLILSTASPVFEAMFYGYFECESIIAIVDIAVTTFKLMIEYIYTDHINDTTHTCDVSKDCTSIETCIELFYCAEKYLLHDLRDKCLWRIQNRLNDKNILRVLDFALGSGIVALQELCMKTLRIMVLTNTKQFRRLVLQISTDYHMSMECVKYIVACNRMIFEKKDIDISLVVMAKKWCRIEAEDRRKQLRTEDNDDEANDEFDVGNTTYRHTYDAIVCEMELLPEIAAAVMSGHDEIASYRPISTDSSYLDTLDWKYWNDLEWVSCYRNSYKSTGLVKIFAHQTYTVCIEINQSIALKKLIVNSRLALLPLLVNDNNNLRHNERRISTQYRSSMQSYDDEFNIKFICDKNNNIFYAEKIQQKNIEYNSKMFLTFRKPVVMPRNQRIRIVFERPSTSECFSDYPCKLYKSIENLRNALRIDFNPESCENVNCIVDAVEYAHIG